MSSVTDYKSGIKHGREALWDANGVVQYDRTYVDGRLVK